MSAIEKDDFLRIKLRLDSSNPADIHRDFTGLYYPRWRSLAINEVRTVRNQIKLIPILEEGQHTKPDGGYYVVEDFEIGSKLPLYQGKAMVVTEVDDSSLQSINPLSTGLNTTQYEANKAKRFSQIREKIKQRAGYKDLVRSMGKHFRILDDSGDRKLDSAELKKAFAMYDLDLEPGEFEHLVDEMDKNDDGQVSYNEFMLAIRGPMSEIRKQCILRAFKKMDYNKDGCLTYNDIEGFYHTSYHPKVQSGEMTEEEVLKKFLSKFDGNGNGIITYEEFEDYYQSISASIDDDGYFVEMMCRVWNLDNKNVSTKRVAAFH